MSGGHGTGSPSPLTPLRPRTAPKPPGCTAGKMAAPCLLSPAGSALAPLETSPQGPRCQAQGDEGRENVGPQSLLLVYVHYQTACTEGACVVLMWLPEW